MTEQADRLLKILRKFAKVPTDEELARIVAYVDKHGSLFTSDEVAVIRSRLCELTQKDELELADTFERGAFRIDPPGYVDDFTHLLPKKGLLPTFVKLTAKTEWATPYRTFAFLGVLGALLGRQICVDQNVYKVWPNMAVLLVGPTGVRKTTCIEYAMKLAMEADIDRFPTLEKVTSEALHAWLAKRDPAVGLVYAPELSTVINKKDYTKGLINDLTRLWDCPDRLDVELISRQETLRNVSLSFLGASNEEWLLKSLPEDAHRGGFLARMLQVYVGSFEQLVSKPSPIDVMAREEVVKGLVRTQICQGTATLTRQADLFFDKRYKEIRRDMLTGTDPRLTAFLNRYHDHMLRLAMLLSISEAQGPQVFIGEEHLVCADGLLAWVAKWLPKIYAFTSLTDAGEDARRVLFLLAKAGGRMSRKRLVGELYGRVTVQRLDPIIRTLQDAGFVREVPSVLFDNTPGRAYYQLTERALQEV